MPSLADFLKEKTEEWQSVFSKTKSVRDEWVRDVNQLIDRMEKWLRVADQNGILEIDVHDVEKREEKIGYYNVRGMTIRLGPREVRVKPIARFVVAAPVGALLLSPQGRVDITNGEKQYLLYHLHDPAGNRWISLSPTRESRAFDQQTFESAIQDLLA